MGVVRSRRFGGLTLTSGVLLAGIILIAPVPLTVVSDSAPIRVILTEQDGVRLEVGSGREDGHLLSSTDLQTWTPWAALPAATTSLVHTLVPMESGSAVASFFKFEAAQLPVPDNFVFIPPGRFLMGSPPTEEGRGIDEDQHWTTVHRGFWMGRTEVTIQEWMEVMTEFPRDLLGGTMPQTAANNMTWAEAIEFCRRLTERDERTGRIPLGSCYRLPTETEWEYAARAGTATRFFFGDDMDYRGLHAVAWFGENAGGGVHPGMQLLPNPWGLYDLHGNVFEWCLDLDTPYPGSQRVLHRRRMFRGGSYYCPGWVLRAAARGHTGDPEQREHLAGVRLVIGYPPDSLRIAEQMPVPIGTRAWAADHLSVAVTLTTSAPGATVLVLRMWPSPTAGYEPGPATRVFTNSVSLKARTSRPAAILSEPLAITIDRAQPPLIELADDRHVLLSTPQSETMIQIRSDPDQPWTSYYPSRLLEITPTLEVRCWHADKFPSQVLTPAAQPWVAVGGGT